jgi:hypothetical protein
MAASTDSEQDEEEEYEKRDIREFLTLPKNFKPKTLDQMKNPNKVYFLKKRGKLTTFPLTYIGMMDRQHKLKMKRQELQSKAISKSKNAKKRRRKRRINPFEGPKGVKIPTMDINWASKTPSNNFVDTIESIQRSKQLNSEGSLAFMKVFVMQKHSAALQAMI